MRLKFLNILKLTCVLCLYGCTLVYGADPVLTPETLSDGNGNAADANSDITWAAIPSFATYSAGSVTYNDNGLGPLYKFAKSFINGAVFPSGLPWGMYYIVRHN